MAKVLLRSTGRSAGTKSVDPRLAEVLVKRGGWQYADVAPAPPAPDLDAMSYNELRALAKEHDLGLGRATKAEIVAALEGEAEEESRSGTYERRDMRAAE